VEIRDCRMKRSASNKKDTDGFALLNSSYMVDLSANVLTFGDIAVSDMYCGCVSAEEAIIYAYCFKDWFF